MSIYDPRLTKYPNATVGWDPHGETYYFQSGEEDPTTESPTIWLGTAFREFLVLDALAQHLYTHHQIFLRLPKDDFFALIEERDLYLVDTYNGTDYQEVTTAIRRAVADVEAARAEKKRAGESG